jgi:hypothetical protein
MSVLSSTKNDDEILAAALSAILGKEILTESNAKPQSQQHTSKISLFDQHLTSVVCGKVGADTGTNKGSFITLQITILSTAATFSYLIERDADVDKLKHMIYEREGIPCTKQNLIYCGREIDEGHLLSEYGIEDSSTIFVVRLRAYNTNDLLILDTDSRDPEYDYDFTNIRDEGKRFSRGGIEYRRPCGWRRFAIKIDGKYENDVWLGSGDDPVVWPVSYHGTGLNAAKSIAQAGYDLTKHKNFNYGRGIYSSPNVDVAKAYAT